MFLYERSALRVLFFVLLLLNGLRQALAEEVTVFDVRNTLALSDREQKFKDFFINGGVEQGLQEGMIVTVQRRQTLYDSYQNRSPGDLMVKVGLIKIIHVQKGLSVARDFASVSRIDHPLLEYDFVMVGDLIDLKTAYIEKRPKKGTELGKTASVEAQATESEATNPIEAPAQAVAPVISPAPVAPLAPPPVSAVAAPAAPLVAKTTEVVQQTDLASQTSLPPKESNPPATLSTPQ